MFLHLKPCPNRTHPSPAAASIGLACYWTQPSPLTRSRWRVSVRSQMMSAASATILLTRWPQRPGRSFFLQCLERLLPEKTCEPEESSPNSTAQPMLKRERPSRPKRPLLPTESGGVPAGAWKPDARLRWLSCKTPSGPEPRPRNMSLLS